jgi:rod shape determining protein RodA
MELSERRVRFLNEVKHYIRSKEAKAFVASELEYHMKQVKMEWVGKGLSEQEAEEKSVSQMGNPAKLGQELNQLHKPRIDWWMISLLAITMGLSFLPLFALGDMYEDSLKLKKAFHVILGAAAALVMMLTDYRKLEKRGWIAYAAGLFMLVMIIKYPPMIVNGVPYIKIGPIVIQSLMVLPFMFLAWAAFFNSRKLKIWQLLILFTLPLLLLLAVPNLSAVFIYTMMVFSMMWWSKISRKNAVKITAAGAILSISFVGLAVFTAREYQFARFFGFLDPEKYPDTYGFMYLKLKERFQTAGWFGPSGKSTQLPFEHTDYVFVGLTYHYGYIFGLGLLLILSLFAARILYISKQIQDSYGLLLLTGAITLYLVQFVYNVGMVVGFLPITSMSLPFISYGLIPTLLNAFIMGVVLSVYRRKDLISNREAV